MIVNPDKFQAVIWDKKTSDHSKKQRLRIKKSKPFHRYNYWVFSWVTDPTLIIRLINQINTLIRLEKLLNCNSRKVSINKQFRCFKLQLWYGCLQMINILTKLLIFIKLFIFSLWILQFRNGIWYDFDMT